MKTIFVVSMAGLVGCGALALARAQQAPSSAPSKAPAREISSLQLQQEIPVPNVMGRLDHMSSDSKRRLLFVSALGNNSAEVIDTFGGRVVHTITEGLSQPQGILYVPDYNKIVIANAENGKVNIYDGTTYQLRKSLDFSPDPDNIRWDAATKLVVVGYGEDDGGIAFIDPQKEEQVGQVLKTGGHPESFQVEQTGGHIYVNCPDVGNSVLSIERKTGKVMKWPLKGLRGNYPMQLDEKNHRLFTVTRKPPMVAHLWRLGRPFLRCFAQ